MANELPKHQGRNINTTFLKDGFKVDMNRNTFQTIKSHLDRLDGHFKASYSCLQRKYWHLPYNFKIFYIFFMLILNLSSLSISGGGRR